MICYFCKSLKFSIQAKIEQRGQKVDSFEKLMQKAVDVEGKAVLWPGFYICYTNQYYFRGSRPTHSITANILPQGYPIKDPQVEEPEKSQELKPPALQHSENAETFEKTQKKKKNKCHHQCGHRAPKNGRLKGRFTPATKVNNTPANGDLRKNQNRPTKQDQVLATCQNCNQKGHNANRCPQRKKEPKNQYQFQQLPHW